MTFKEYLQIDRPMIRHPLVFLEKEDIASKRKSFDHYRIGLLIHGEYFMYRVQLEGGLLWTIDDDGNRKAPSVFIFLNPAG